MFYKDINFLVTFRCSPPFRNVNYYLNDPFAQITFSTQIESNFVADPEKSLTLKEIEKGFERE